MGAIPENGAVADHNRRAPVLICIRRVSGLVPVCGDVLAVVFIAEQDIANPSVSENLLKLSARCLPAPQCRADAHA